MTISLATILEQRAKDAASRVALIYLRDGEDDELRLTYGELYERAVAVAQELMARGCKGRPVLILHESDLEYVVSVFACFYAQAIAVTAYPVGQAKHLPRLQSVIADSSAQVALTSQIVAEKMQGLTSLDFIVTENFRSGSLPFQLPDFHSDDVAFLQYTSGSTSDPKGVMITHGSLLANTRAQAETMRTHEGSVGVSWLPLFHDMGLMTGPMHAILQGYPLISMSPAHFIQKPGRWLQAISKYRATFSGGPTFAFELCNERLKGADLQGLDLSSWECGFISAEPVKATTVRKFSEKFASCGLRPGVLKPCYGLAEATLVLSGTPNLTPLTSLFIMRSALEKGWGHSTDRDTEGSFELVSLGKTFPGHSLVAVHPSGRPCAPLEIGEIWASGPSIAKGYWKKPDLTTQIFHAELHDPAFAGKNFLRTGDLGFLTENGELFLTGRAKDLLIINGRNLYPQDIESSAQSVSKALRSGRGTAFSLNSLGDEKIVIVQELIKGADVDAGDLCARIRAHVIAEFEVEIHAIALIEADQLPITSSGKVKRSASRDLFLNKKLSHVAEWNADAPAPPAAPAPPGTNGKEVIFRRCLELVATRLRLPPSSIEVWQELSTYGMSSLAATHLINDLRDAFGIELTLSYLLQEASLLDIVSLAKASGKSSLSLASIAPIEVIQGADRSKALATSFMQDSLLLIDQTASQDPDRLATNYNIQAAIRLEGRLDLQALKQALTSLRARHESLRTTFAFTDSGWTQIIHSPFEAELEIVDLSPTELDSYLEHERSLGFSLSGRSLYRFSVANLRETERVLVITAHHSVGDGWSMGILFKDLSGFYQDALAGRAARTETQALQFVDFAAWQKRMVTGSAWSSKLEFWKDTLRDLPELIHLPLDYPRPSVQNFRSESVGFSLTPAQSASLRELAARAQTTEFVVLASLYSLFLYRYTGQLDMAIGMPVANRTRSEWENVVGCFVNSVVIRTHLQVDLSILELIGIMKSRILSALNHQDLPFDLLVRELNPIRSSSYHPIFQVYFNLEDVRFEDLSIPGIQARPVDKKNVSVFDLNLSIRASNGVFAGEFIYRADLFLPSTIERMAENFKALIASTVSDITQTVQRAQIISPAERGTLMRFNASDVDFPDAKLCIHEIIERQVERSPEARASEDSPRYGHPTDHCLHRDLLQDILGSGIYPCRDCRLG